MNRNTSISPLLVTGGLLGALALALAAPGGCGGDKSTPGGQAGAGGGAASGGRSGNGGGNPGSGGAGSPGTGGSASGAGGGAGSPGGSGGAPGAGGAGQGSGGAPGGSDAAGGAAGAPAVNAKTTVVIFMIDGLQADAAKTAAANGAANLKMIIEQGVTVTQALSTTPAARTPVADGSLAWGNATSGNIVVHTGTHLIEAGPAGLDDIFRAARTAGMKSVFSGGDANYSGLNTADFKYAASIADAIVVQQAITHLKMDKVRLLRLHLQRIRDVWNGPAGKTNATSAYLRGIVAADGLLGMLIQALKDEGVWDDTYLIVTADHGMGTGAGSDHPPSTRSSWDIFMGFYGPGLKKGAAIPYAELPDVGVTAAHFLGLTLKGHTGNTNIAQKGATGTVLKNLFLGAPDEITHPRYIDQYLKQGTFSSGGSEYAPYRAGMISVIK